MSQPFPINTSSLRSIEMHTARWAFGGPLKITEGFRAESRWLRVEIKLCSCLGGPQVAFGNSDPLDLSQRFKLSNARDVFFGGKSALMRGCPPLFERERSTILDPNLANAGPVRSE